MSILESPRARTMRAKLRAIILTTSALALVTASGAFLTYDYFSFRRSMENRLQVLTEVMATQTAPALAFNDARVASEILGTLAAAPQIVCAALYGRNGVLLTQYVRAYEEYEVDHPQRGNGKSEHRHAEHVSSAHEKQQ